LESKDCQSETISRSTLTVGFLLKCEGIGGYKLELKYGSGFSRLSIVSPNGQKREIDYFENIGYGSVIESKVEWRVQREGKQIQPLALIVEINTIENLENLAETLSLGVIKLTANSVCLTDAVKRSANRQIKARSLADASAKKPCLATAQNTLLLNKLTGEIPMLISKLADKDKNDPQDEIISELAANALVKVGAKAVPPLIESLKQNKLCEFQMLAADTIRQIDSRQEIVKTTLFNVASGKCAARHGHDSGAFFAMVTAASILANEIEGGIPLVTKLLKEEVGIIPAIYAFSDLVGSISKQKQNKIEIKSEIIRDLKAAIPTLAETLENKDEKLRCGYYEILKWMQKSGFEELQTEATRALQGKNVDCK
jgi:hypothetical protein